MMDGYLRLSKFNLRIQRTHSITILLLVLLAMSCSFALSHRNIGPRQPKSRDYITWETPELPDIKRAVTFRRNRAQFHGTVPRKLNTTCDINCQMGRTTKPSNLNELTHDLSFETLDMRTSVCIKTVLEVGFVPPKILNDEQEAGKIRNVNSKTKFQITPTEATRAVVEENDYEYYYDDGGNSIDRADKIIDQDGVINRRKRNIFGFDTRFSLPSRNFMTLYPFSTAVKLSTGCSGVLLSPKHVLTSAHCIHDGKRYVKGVRKLKAGKMMTTIQNNRKKRKRSRKNEVGKKARKKKIQARQENFMSDTGTPHNSTRRDVSALTQSILPYFKWVRAKKTNIPQGWLDAAGQVEYPLEYDYAVVELKRALGPEYMDIGMSPDRENIPEGHRIHFTGFDSDRMNQMLYRFCAIEDASPDLMYHFCDAAEGTSGSGIYIRLYDKQKKEWSRKVIGVFSGHQWVKFPDGTSKEYNTGVRITPLKYAQICFWTKGDYSLCQEG